MSEIEEIGNSSFLEAKNSQTDDEGFATFSRPKNFERTALEHAVTGLSATGVRKHFEGLDSGILLLETDLRLNSHRRRKDTDFTMEEGVI
jgi:hypothetical protein